ncbi:MAG: DUF3604 domain-containing protein, partial [bacterium]|nr:DUF3604 domain-containing protein [bacterium]
HAYPVSGDLLVESNRLPFAGQISEGRNYADICAGFLDLDQTHPVRERPASDWKQWKPIRLPEKSTAAVRPTIEANGKTYKLYWGDPHCHGNLSGDAEGEIDENYTYGRYKSCLDFMAVTDNDALYDNVFTPSEWALVQASARHFNEPGHFVAIPAYERTVPLEKGRGQNHRIQLFPQEGGPLYHWTEPDANTLKKWLGKMKNTGAYTFLHHTNWKAVPSPTLGGVEVCSSWDIYIHISKTIQEGLRNGLRLAFQGDSDSHRIVPGQGGALTGVWAEDLPREAIFEALWARRCFATNGERLLMDVRINGKPMGSEVHTTAPVTLTCNIQAPRQILSVELYRTGERIATKKISKKKASIEFEDRPSKGEHPYYIQVNLKPLPRTPMGARCGNLQVARGDYAWSSPIWAIVE